MGCDKRTIAVRFDDRYNHFYDAFAKILLGTCMLDNTVHL
jgi:hypothetical protein